MGAIVICSLDLQASTAQRALRDRVSLSLMREEGELLFIGDPVGAPGASPQNVLALRFRRRVDAELFMADIQAHFSTVEGGSIRFEMQLIRPRQPSREGVSLPLMFP